MVRLAVVLAASALFVVTAGPAEAQKKDRYRLTIEEINERQDLTHAYDAVRQLRPQWLRPARPRGDLGGGAMATTPYRPQPEGRTGAAGENNESARAAADARDAARAAAGRRKVDPVLYIDDMKQPELEDMLRTVRIGEIAEIRYVGGTQALALYGAGHEAGAILVQTKRMPR